MHLVFDFAGEFKFAIFLKNSGSKKSGARDPQVEEPVLAPGCALFRPESVFQAEFEVVAGPKALLSDDLQDLVKKHGGYNKAGLAIGASEAFVRQNSGLSRKSSKKRVR